MPVECEYLVLISWWEHSPLKSREELRNENEALRARAARLTEASLRISASLDLPTVLREVVESARSLTDARYGLIATVDEAGRPQDVVTSGLTDEEHRQLVRWPDGPRLFEYLRDLPGPLRVADMPTHVQRLGFSGDRLPPGSFLGMPMHRRGLHIGNFYLVEKQGGRTFTDEDEEVLVLFASQAATAIANARTHREERRARADLEALVDTSPVGVAVFDAATGRPVSFNNEAKRIVEPLRSSGQTHEQLLDFIKLRRADGEEIALSEVPIAGHLSRASRIRAEKFVLSVPDGHSVATLVNVTPIKSADDRVVSVVVTMQDLAPLEEMDKRRTEFVSMVSHELRAPLASISGSVSALLETWETLHPAEMREYFRLIKGQANHMRSLVSDLLDAGRVETGTLSVTSEPHALATLVETARNTFLGGGSRHPILIDLPPGLPRVAAEPRRIVQVLINLFSNAARHSPESSPIRVEAALDAMHVAISVADRGRGVAPELLPYLFQKHRHAGDGAPGIGGGLGLAICKGLIEAHGGRIWAESPGLGQGTRFTFTLPLAAEAPSEDPAPDRPDRFPDARGNARILVLDDDPLSLRFIRDTLTEAGYAVAVTGDPVRLPALIRNEAPHLVLIDLVLPEADGIELMRTLPELAERPVIVISAYARSDSVANALTAGAADYIVKPFSPAELVARVRAALRRRAAPEPVTIGGLTMHLDSHQVTLAGRPLELTATEFEMLRILSVNPGSVLSVDKLLQTIWAGRSRDASVVRAVIKNLRRKLSDDARKPIYIANVRGVGYRMKAPGTAG